MTDLHRPSHRHPDLHHVLWPAVVVPLLIALAGLAGLALP